MTNEGSEANEPLPKFKFDAQKSVDDSWKDAVKKEKQDIVKPQAAEQGEEPGEPDKEPMSVFSEMIVGMYSQALVFFGAEPEPSGKRVIRLEVGESSLGVLMVLREKTKGNLTPQEEKTINSAIGDLTVCRAEAVKYLTKMKQQQQQPKVPR